MKNSLIVLFILMVLFSCGSSTRFHRQKYTHLQLNQTFEDLAEKQKHHATKRLYNSQVLNDEVVTVETLVNDMDLLPGAASRVNLQQAILMEAPQKQMSTPTDTIITISGDTILCTVKRMNRYELKYMIEKDGYTISASVPKAAVQKYVKGSYIYVKDIDEGRNPAEKKSSRLAKMTRIGAFSSLGVGLALLVFVLLSLDFALVLSLIFFPLLILTAILFLQTLFWRKIERFEAEDPVKNAKEIKKLKIHALVSIIYPFLLTILITLLFLLALI